MTDDTAGNTGPQTRYEITRQLGIPMHTAKFSQTPQHAGLQGGDGNQVNDRQNAERGGRTGMTGNSVLGPL